MTERGSGSLAAGEKSFRVGPSSLSWSGNTLLVDFDEAGPPFPPVQWLPRRLKGRVALKCDTVTQGVFDLTQDGSHRWWPISPTARIEVSIEKGGLPSWEGDGYIDTNWGMSPVENTFHSWEWARGRCADGSAVLIYDALETNASRHTIGLRSTPGGHLEGFEVPLRQKLRNGFWGVERHVHCDSETAPNIKQPLEDTPFYTRSLVETSVDGNRLLMMHESFSGPRLASPLVKLMLPVRMPRRRHWRKS